MKRHSSSDQGATENTGPGAHFEAFLNSLSVKLDNPLPGPLAHYDFVRPFGPKTLELLLGNPVKPLLNQPGPAQKVPPATRESSSGSVKQCAVLILVYPKDGKPHFIVTERQTYKGQFSGDMCLPGGKFEQGDVTLEATALRETFEEVGIEPDSVKILSEMTPLAFKSSNLIVTPFIGVSTACLSNNFRPDEREVAEIVEVSLDQFLQQETTGKIKQKMGNTELEVPCFFVGDDRTKIVWGLTGNILAEFRSILTS